MIFTTNVYGDAARLHRLRRSFCKAWRNDKWRDLSLTFEDATPSDDDEDEDNGSVGPDMPGDEPDDEDEE